MSEKVEKDREIRGVGEKPVLRKYDPTPVSSIGTSKPWTKEGAKVVAEQRKDATVITTKLGNQTELIDLDSD